MNEGKFPGRKGDFIKFKGEYFDIKKTAGSTAYVKFPHTASHAFSQVWGDEVKLGNEKHRGKRVWVMEQKLNINEGIMYNVDAGIALHKNPYRYGSTKFFEYYNDLRALKLESVSEDLDMFLSSDIGKVGVYEGNDVLLDFPMLVEAEYQGKTVQLSKPMRNNSGGGKFKVYVKDPKSGNVRMIKFGADSGGGKLAVKLKDPKAKAAFKARHNCEQTKDKTTASYWSCRLPRYAKSLGLSGGGQWW